MKNDIVITGMGAVTPLGVGVDTYWNNMIAGKSGIRYISRFDASSLPVTFAGEVPDFQPEEFMTKKQVKEMELFMQFGYAAADEALRDAGLIEDENGNLPIARERIGIVLGTVFSGISEIADVQDKISTGAGSKVGPRFITRIIGNIAAAEIAISRSLRGPSITVSTACSSGIDAISTGIMLIEQDMADAVICVGAEAATTPLTIQGLSSIHALSRRNDAPAEASRPFDLNRDGFVMAEGGGAVIIEKKESALRRDARIRCNVAGYANSTDGYHVTSPHPEGIAAIFCMEQAVRTAGMKLTDVDYINAHGTSTPKGDIIEIGAIKTLFGDHARKLAVSSTKSSTGHLMGAGGVTETIACVKALEEGILPPTINQTTPDPECDLDVVPNEARKANIRTAMCNAFGFGGQNASLLLTKAE
ncbi:MAG: beta-ketoacyl-ACP synthase II [Eubacterium sp.]|nr:beta-ketoacyl-ACP synthase II [Eubacterium sp.]